IQMEKTNNHSNSIKLLSQTQVCEEGKGWHRSVYQDIAARLTGDTGFPCIFSRNAFKKQLLKFIFVETIASEGIQYLSEGLQEYIDLANQWPGTLDTAYPLLVAFSLNAIHAQSVDDYHALGWQVIQKLHEVDPKPWPENVAQDPESSSWAFCFNGMPLFCNMSNPAHRVRKSRNLGKHFIMVINPRERFDIFAGDHQGGRNVRANIRKRIAAYDGIQHASQLGSYGINGLEWWQYGLIETNTERKDKCPFKFMKSLFSSQNIHHNK
ncbi:MAG TPA: YqcI/YcgG family protein, partial [Legionellaceae bacterium]|nr:YqcI/YcgG family protein [Legionellaceae bacterium]